MKSQLLILDFGSQYTQLIARTVRELGVYCEIVPGNQSAEKILAREPKALILSGGPASVREEGSPRVERAVLQAGIPVFAICYGMQLLADELGGSVHAWSVSEDRDSASREYGPALACIHEPVGPFSCFQKSEEIAVWMSHGDKVGNLPDGFEVVASSPGAPVAAFANSELRMYGVQFHPEVHHTPRGKEILSHFLFQTAGVVKDWDASGFIRETVHGIASKVPAGNVVCGLSGGVDSTVAAVLVHQAIGDRLHCIFVDNGLLRAGEAEQVMTMMQELGLNVKCVDASHEFLSELAGVTDPEQKRKIIGRV
ncbi:MAG: glutamine-hydrolyzing GMP synthase, partial [bacterium]|nr:glutamine-hydrolyzing GMP synthase [bacterium]